MARFGTGRFGVGGGIAIEGRLSALESAGATGMIPVAGGPVAVATTANITLSGEQTIDGVLTSASRVLVKNQSTAAQNGIYVSAAGAWTRATDLDAAGEFAKASVSVTGGTVNGGRVYYQSATVTTVGTDAVTWVLTQDQSALAAQVVTLRTSTLARVIASVVSGEFVPELLFLVNNDKGFYLDPAAPGALCTDTAGTTPVSTTGDLVKFADLVYPGGSAGADLAEATNPPAYLVTGDGAKLIRFDGTNDFLSAAGVDFAGCSAVTIVMGIVQNFATSSPDVLLEHGSGIAVSTGGFGAYINDTGTGSFGGGVGLGAAAYLGNRGGARAASRPYVATLVIEPGAASVDDKVRIRVNSVELDEDQTSNLGTVTAGAFALRTLYLGARAGTSRQAQFDLAWALVIGRKLTDAEIVAAEAFAQKRLNPALPYAVSLSDWSDSALPVQSTLHLRSSTFAQAEFRTSANLIELTAYADLTIAGLRRLGVYVDGAFQEQITVSGTSGAEFPRIALPVGEHVVSIISGPQSRPSGTITGTHLISLRADKPLVQIGTADASDILVYGDSIAVGDGSTTPMQDAWPLQVRLAAEEAGQRLAVEAFGFRALWDDAVDGTARAVFVAKLAAYGPSKILLSIGTNDYGLNRWSAASFGTAYAALLDAINVALPLAQIICVTPILRSTETANGSGSTTGDYRTQIATAVSTRGSYATLVNGAAILTTGQLADGVHPTTAGAALIATAVKTALGLP